jgi:hypothetical protein
MGTDTPSVPAPRMLGMFACFVMELCDPARLPPGALAVLHSCATYRLSCSLL